MAQYAESWLQLEAASGGRVALQGTAADKRQQFAGLFATLSPNYPAASDAVRTTDGTVQGIRYRIYCPRLAATASLLPIGLFMHGGGFILGGLDSEDMLCRAFSEQSMTILVSLDYRLAPEHKHPAQLKDSKAVFEWAYANASSFGGDANQLYTIGTSAGATLALLAAREVVCGRSTVPVSSLRSVIAISPITVHPRNVPGKFRLDYKSYAEFGEGAPVITRSAMLGFLEDAAIAPDDGSCFLLLDEETLRKFSQVQVYIATAECDPLRDDGRALVSALRAAGVAVREKLYRGLPHCFWFFNSLPEWQNFIKNTVAEIKRI